MVKGTRDMGLCTAVFMVHETCTLHGTWPMVHGTWYTVHGTCYMVHGTWYMAHGENTLYIEPVLYMILGSWYMVHGTKYMLYNAHRRHIIDAKEI
jgi:hypothetical protein